MKKLLLFLLGLAMVAGISGRAQDAKDITGTWQGTLQAGKALRTVVKISKADAGGLKAIFYSIDQGGQPIPVSTITAQGATVKMAITAIGGTYEGKLSADGTGIVGTFNQGGNALPLNLLKVTPETAWAIPEPPARVPPMAADANPSFEVATIKPSKPDQQGKGITVRGRRFMTINTTLTDLVTFAYGLHARQLIGAPAWMETEKFDISAQPDVEGSPNDKQLKLMLTKLLADRFNLTFHHEKKELSVYALLPGKAGPKVTKSEGDPNGLPGLGFGALGKLVANNATMVDFTNLMQATVLDRPVVDQSGLVGRYDFTLNWTPDESQFGGMGMKVPPPTDAANAPPPLFTAIQEQMGMKLEATKAPVDVLAIDKVEKPSDN